MREINYHDDDLSVRLVVRSATVQIGMKRTLIAEQARKEENERGELPEGDIDELSRRILHTIIYPSLIAATVEHEGLDWPLSFEAFRELPEKLESQWELAVYELNEHWRPGGVEVDQEKKA